MPAGRRRRRRRTQRLAANVGRLFQLRKQHGMNADYLVVPGANHYTMSEKLLDDSNPLTQAMIRQMGI